MPAIDVRSARQVANKSDMTYPQDMEASIVPEYYACFLFNTFQASETAPSFGDRNRHNLENTMFASRS